jgi:hypothetical protein
MQVKLTSSPFLGAVAGSAGCLGKIPGSSSARAALRSKAFEVVSLGDSRFLPNVERRFSWSVFSPKTAERVIPKFEPIGHRLPGCGATVTSLRFSKLET